MFKRKQTTSIQFEEHQIKLLEKKAAETALIEKRKVSMSEIVRNAIDKYLQKNN